MTSEEFKKHLKSYSPNDVYTYSFSEKEVKEICESLDQKSLVEEINKLLKEESQSDTLWD